MQTTKTLTMAALVAHSTLSLSLAVIYLFSISSQVSAQLSPTFYDTRCSSVFDTVRSGMQSAINREARMGASIIRLFFHDCFVSGCDGSVLLDGDNGEQTAPANSNSARGFEVIDTIKASVDRACGAGIVSCADILAIAARDATAQLGGPSYTIPVGRRDARTSNRAGAISDLPSPFEDLNPIITKFRAKGFTEREMVVLSGSHTVGQAQCRVFRNRIYNETNIDPSLASERRANCPAATGNGDGNLAPLDPQSPNRFGNNYFQALMNRRGLLHSDQVLFNGGTSDSIVRSYSNDANAFSTDFANAMVKMGNLSPLTGTQGEIRNNCGRAN